MAARAVGVPPVRAGLLDVQRMTARAQRSLTERELKSMRPVTSATRHVAMGRLVSVIDRAQLMTRAARARGRFGRLRSWVRIVASDARPCGAELGMVRVHALVAARTGCWGARADVVGTVAARTALVRAVFAVRPTAEHVHPMAVRAGGGTPGLERMRLVASHALGVASGE